MQTPLTTKQILDILATEPALKHASDEDLSRLVRRIEWEHKIGDDPFGFTNQKMVRQKEEALQKRMGERMPNQKKWTTEKLSELLASHKNGEKPSDIAGRLGLTRQRVYDLIRKAERDEKRTKQEQECPFDGLSVRARNAILSCVPERTLDSAYALVASGGRLTGIGAGTRYELKKFLLDKGYKFHGG